MQWQVAKLQVLVSAGPVAASMFLQGDIPAATTIAVFVVGSTAYNRWKLNMATAQLAEFTESGEGPVATTELVFRPYNSSPIVQTDAFTVVFD